MLGGDEAGHQDCPVFVGSSHLLELQGYNLSSRSRAVSLVQVASQWKSLRNGELYQDLVQLNEAPMLHTRE